MWDTLMDKIHRTEELRRELLTEKNVSVKGLHCVSVRALKTNKKTETNKQQQQQNTNKKTRSQGNDHPER